MLKSIAALLSESSLMVQAKELYALNSKDWSYQLTKMQKLQVGVYMILRDYAQGLFPPNVENELQAFDAERKYSQTILSRGARPEDVRRYGLQKPFLPDLESVRYVRDYACLLEALLRLSVVPPARILEAGCGTGWMSEFLAATGYQVTATTIAPDDEVMIQSRKKSLEIKELNPHLEFSDTPMEYLSDVIGNERAFDAVFVYEALHHAHDWKKALAEFSKILRPGGWCLICNEPNKVHTFTSYRIGRLSNTHEIGMSRKAIIRELERLDFGPPQIIRNRFHAWIRPIWIAAQLKASS